MIQDLVSIHLRYGRSGQFAGEILGKRLLLYHKAAANVTNPAREVRSALANPTDFPDVRKTFVPGDRVVLALDPETPESAAVIAEFWNVLDQAGVTAESVTILQPAVWEPVVQGDPRSDLPEEVRSRVTFKRHDPTEEGGCAYLASTASGERIQLSRELIDADVVVCLGPARYDTVLGYRGTSSGLYPGFSDTDAIRKTLGQGHDELEPDDSRPLRQVVDEVGWLLGTQLAVSVIPGAAGGIQSVISGQSESVMKKSRETLDQNWRVETSARAELVLVSVDSDAAGHGWSQVAAAIDAARRIVERDGRIVVLSQLERPLTPGLELLRQARTPRDALKPIRQAVPPDLVAATRIAKAVDWANVYLLSGLEANLVEDLFMVPLESEAEVQRLLQGDDSTAVLESGQNTFAICRSGD